MLDALHEFCLANSMFVNAKKSEVVLFGAPGAGGSRVFTCGGAVLETKPHYKYLGLVFEGRWDPAGMQARAMSKAKGAASALFGKCYRLKLHNPNTQVHLFDSLARPLLCFGCELWGPDLASELCKPGKELAGSDADADVHLPFLRQSLGLGTQTPRAPLLAELGRDPLPVFWLTMAAKLWNRALGREPDDFMRLALQANLATAKRRGAEVKGMWAFEFTTCLQRLGLGGAWGTPTDPKRVDVGALERAAQQLWANQAGRAASKINPGGCLPLRQIPDSDSRGFMQLTYQRWFQADDWVRKESFSFNLHSHVHVRAVARMRLGMHGLAVQSGRMLGRDKVPRSMRRCLCCGAQREDEMHLLVECPLYIEHRRVRPGLFSEPRGGWTDDALRKRFNPDTREGWEGLATFLVACFETRSTKLDEITASAPRGRTRREGPRT